MSLFFDKHNRRKSAAARLLEQIHGNTGQTVDLLQPELIVRSTCIKKKGGEQQ